MSSNIRTILFPTDFSESARSALGLAFALARDCQARLIVLHVASPPAFVSYGEFEKALQESSPYRHELEEHLRDHQTPDCRAEFVLKEGDPGSEIIHLAEELACDLIVMGTHGRSGLDRLLLGSVAGKVLRRAPCPVLTVKTPLARTALPDAKLQEPAAV